MSLIHIEGPEHFQKEILAFDGLCIVDFWAERCGPCRMLGPIMEELATIYEGKPVRIAKVNVDENPELAAQFNVSSIPVVFFLQGGETGEMIVGVNPKTVYQERIDTFLATYQAKEEKLAA